jgi:hypothetical protein
MADTPEDDADAAALLALISSLPKIPRRRTYALEHIDGEWVFRRLELELVFDEVMEEIFGPDPALHDDRRSGFKLP